MRTSQHQYQGRQNSFCCITGEKYRKALDYYELALTVKKAVYGNEHPDVAATLRIIGEAWNVLGEYRKTKT